MMMLRIVSIVILCILTIDAGLIREQWKEHFQWKKMEQRSTDEFETRAIGFNGDRKSYVRSMGPPPINHSALMARYIVNQAEWAAVATISTRKDIEGFPTSNLISISDGLYGNGSGIPYMYITPLDYTAQDLLKDNRTTFLMTLAQGTYCKNKNLDQMDPRCARIMLSGKVEKINNMSTDYKFAKEAVFSRHPTLRDMPESHHFFFAKLLIAKIALLDSFGGPKYISVQDYLNPTTKVAGELQRRFSPKLMSQKNAILESQFPQVHRI